MVFGVLRINPPRHKNNHTSTTTHTITTHCSHHRFLQNCLLIIIIFFLLPCIQKFWVKGVQNTNIFDWRIHYPQCLSNLEAIGRKHFVKALPSEYSFSSTLRIFFSALPIFFFISPQDIHLCSQNILLY